MEINAKDSTFSPPFQANRCALIHRRAFAPDSARDDKLDSVRKSQYHQPWQRQLAAVIQQAVLTAVRRRSL